MELCLQTKRFKSQIEDGGRDKEVLERVREKSGGLINQEFIENLYGEIIKESKKLQKKDHKLIAFQGEHGAYGEMAAKVWDAELIPHPCDSFASVFEGVESDLYEYGIVPVENTLGGVLGQVNELLIRNPLKVVGAVELPVRHCLMVVHGTDYREIRSAYSHPQALIQCRHFLARNKIEPIQYSDTAGAAKMLSESKLKGAAAIASKLSATLYNLEIIKEDIADQEINTTRFLVLSRSEGQEDGNKCSILFSTEHKAGTLFRVLELFAKEDLNLTRIESVPSERGHYAFFLDFEGSAMEQKVQEVLEKVQAVTSDFRMMGCYRERKGT
jgi:prephenate dehydratase/chorismate mutase/prephenate dehydratase